MLELNELLELEEVIRDVLNDDLERILIELNRTGELETFLRLLGMHDYLGTEAEGKCNHDGTRVHELVREIRRKTTPKD